MKEDNTMRNATIIGASFILSLFIINAVVGPLYNVWAQSLQGKAELQKAEYTRQVAVLEAQAKKDSAQQLADAEVIRAQGVAKANQIIGNSLKDKTIYVPTEGGMPVPTLQMNK